MAVTAGPPPALREKLRTFPDAENAEPGERMASVISIEPARSLLKIVCRADMSANLAARAVELMIAAPCSVSLYRMIQVSVGAFESRSCGLPQF
jgi:hypothetical protein